VVKTLPASWYQKQKTKITKTKTDKIGTNVIKPTKIDIIRQKRRLQN
jgi:hypothetical protein